MSWLTVDRAAIDRFLEQHPDLPLPAALVSISVQFDGRGDLVSYEARDDQDRPLSLGGCLTPAFSAFLERGGRLAQNGRAVAQTP